MIAGTAVPSGPKSPWKSIGSMLGTMLYLIVVSVPAAVVILAWGYSIWIGNSALEYSNYQINPIEMVELQNTIQSVQSVVDAMDRQIQNEIQEFKNELSKKVDDNLAEVAMQFSELGGKVQSMENSECVSRDDFHKFTENFKNFKSFDSLGDPKIDEIRAFMRNLVEMEINKHAADGMGRVDYAAASAGGMVIDHSGPVEGKGSWFNRKEISSDSMKILKPSFGEPGQCFSLKGDVGFVEIKLRATIVTDAITLEHVDKSVAFDRSSAPKRFQVHGLLHQRDMFERHFLGEFEYDLKKRSVQTFKVMNMGNQGIVDTIRVDFLSNHGNPGYTCIYRLRVHGHEPNSLPSPGLHT